MARLFLFAIGGTGSRVLKSLVFLLASGVKPKYNEYEIIPIIIDPHQSNKDLKRTTDLLEWYQQIFKECGTDSGFFSTQISTLKDLVKSETQISDTFKFNLQEVSDKRFKDFIDLDGFENDSPNKALMEILFSGKTADKSGNEIDLMELQMDMGFVGNPNIGSIVLNQFKESAEFKEFASNFNNSDRIFIISSIFGGTGAAGFPIILKNIRGARTLETDVDGRGYLENSMIGALTVMPYFNIKKESKSPIQKSDFISKTKQALYYYKENVTGNNSINAMYYLGDDYIGMPYENDPGANGQQNDAHFVELAAALSIIDFLEIPESKLKCKNGVAINPVYKEYGIENDTDSVKFKDLSDATLEKISLQMCQFYLFYKYMTEQLNAAIVGQAWCKDSPLINSTFEEYKSLKKILEQYYIWLSELSENKRSFSPILLKNTITNFIADIISSKKVNFSVFDHILNGKSEIGNFNNEVHKLVHLFYDSTKELLTENYDYFRRISK